jgi:Uma2 family endonuclease
MVSTASRIKTYEDFLNTPEDSYGYELYDGEIHVSPTPAQRHQWIAGELFLLIAPYVKAHGLGKVSPSPLSVRFDENVVLEPDMLFVRAGSEADNPSTTWLEAAPALVVEILSRSTANRDLHRKRELYEQYGVEEYWIVDSKKETILALTLVNGNYEPIPQANGMFTSRAVPGLVVRVSDAF